jgi:glutathione S-transferase
VRIALAEKHLSWEPIHVNLRANEHKTPEFLALNPYGKVPVLLDQGAVIYESTVVNEYLEDRFPDPPLMPHDPLGRAEVRLWEDYGDNAFLGPAEGIFVHDKGAHSSPSVCSRCVSRSRTFSLGWSNISKARSS